MLKKRAFTLIEVMIVVVIIGILASVAAGNFGSSVKKARARDARNNLVVIHSANLMYKARNAKHCVENSECADITNINNMNGTQTLNIVANGATYTCQAGPVGCPFQCTATGTNFEWTLCLVSEIKSASPSTTQATNNPYCEGSACP